MVKRGMTGWLCGLCLLLMTAPALAQRAAPRSSPVEPIEVTWPGLPPGTYKPEMCNSTKGPGRWLCHDQAFTTYGAASAGVMETVIVVLQGTAVLEDLTELRLQLPGRLPAATVVTRASVEVRDYTYNERGEETPTLTTLDAFATVVPDDKYIHLVRVDRLTWTSAHPGNSVFNVYLVVTYPAR